VPVQLHVRRLRRVPRQRLHAPPRLALQRPAVPQRPSHGGDATADAARRGGGVRRRPGRGGGVRTRARVRAAPVRRDLRRGGGWMDGGSRRVHQAGDGRHDGLTADGAARVTVKGMLTPEELARLVDTGEIDTVVVGFSDHYGRLCGKRFDAEFFVEDVVDHGTHGCDYLLTTDMEMEPVPGYGFANWELGYGDMHLVPDMATLRRAAWLDRTAIVLCDLPDVAVAPRTI